MISLQENIALAPYTTFKIGGPARWFACVRTAEELQEAFMWAKEKGMQTFLLGGGSNILVSDKGFSGLVIRLEQSDPKREELSLIAFAGTTLGSVVDMARDYSLEGMQNLAGIPGLVGGAVRGNAGAFGVEVKDIIFSVKALHPETLQEKVFSNEECHFSYRSSVFKEEGWIVTEATFKLRPGKKEVLAKTMEDIVAQRNEKHNQSALCAGSFFINPVVENEDLRKEFEKESNSICREKKVPAGWLIDKMGLRGKRIGDAMVSEMHPNYIVNAGEATAEDVVMLMSYIKQQVRDGLGVQLTQEVQLVGFE